MNGIRGGREAHVIAEEGQAAGRGGKVQIGAPAEPTLPTERGAAVRRGDVAHVDPEGIAPPRPVADEHGASMCGDGGREMVQHIAGSGRIDRGERTPARPVVARYAEHDVVQPVGSEASVRPDRVEAPTDRVHRRGRQPPARTHPGGPGALVRPDRHGRIEVLPAVVRRLRHLPGRRPVEIVDDGQVAARLHEGQRADRPSAWARNRHEPAPGRAAIVREAEQRGRRAGGGIDAVPRAIDPAEVWAPGERVHGDPVLVVEEGAGGIVLHQHGGAEGEPVVVRALDGDGAAAVAHVEGEGLGVDRAVRPDRHHGVRGTLEGAAHGHGQAGQVARRPRPAAVLRGREARVDGGAVGVEPPLLEDRHHGRGVVRVERDRGLHLGAAAVILAVAATASARAPKPPVCRDGRFVTPPGTPPLIAGAIVAAPEALVIGGATPTIAIAGHCPAVRVRIRGTRKGTRVVASWPKNACGPGKAQLTAMIDAGCHAMQGVLRVSRSRPVHFIAPRCGDGIIDTVDGEACDGAAGCDAGQECSPDCRCVARSEPPPAVSFGGDVQPIFSARCAVPLCHSGATPTQGLDLSPGRSYAAIVGRPSTERPDLKIVDPGAPATSYLEWKISGAPAGQSILGSPMPLTGGPLPAAEQAIIRAWIAEGAVNDQPASTTSTTVPSTSTTVVTVTSTSTTADTTPGPPTQPA